MKKLLIISEYFPPDINSAADLVSSLSLEFLPLGYNVLVLSPSCDLNKFTEISSLSESVDILHVKVPDKNSRSRIYRAFIELIAPVILLLGFVLNEKRRRNYTTIDAIVWYSPTIFFGPIIFFLKRWFAAKTFLILRDLFPAWAVDVGLIRNGSLIHGFFRLIERFQYKQADFIGVQSVSTVDEFKIANPGLKGEVMLLENWGGQAIANEVEKSGSSILINNSRIKAQNKKVLVYAGNMGVAQNLGVIIRALKPLQDEIHLLCIGSGDDVPALKRLVSELKLSNVEFLPQVTPDKLPAYYNAADMGLVALDLSHKTHNIPGKFISYMQYGLPVFAVCNKNNDLIDIIAENGVGWSVSCDSETTIMDQLYMAISCLKESDFKSNSLQLSHSRFSSQRAAFLIDEALNCRDNLF